MRRTGASLLAASALAIFATVGDAARQATRAGDLDGSFGAGGRVTTDLTPGTDRACCVAIQRDGRIVVAGSKGASGASAGKGFVARYLANGTFDATFGGTGTTTPNFSGGDDLVQGLAIQSDGKIVVTGTTVTPNVDVALARYNTDGTLDTSFGGGKVTTSFGPSTRDRAVALALQADGKIVVAGAARGAGLPTGNFLVARYNSDGTLDASFGDGGKTITDFGSLGEAHAVAVDAEGKAVAVGALFTVNSAGAFWGRSFLTAKYNPDGSLAWKSAVNFGAFAAAWGVAIQRDGKIVTVGWVDSHAAVVRQNPDGTLDSSFGDEGKVVLDQPGGSSLNSVVIDTHDRILAVGTATDESPDFEVVRFTRDGHVDQAFGDEGMVLTNFDGASIDEAFGAALAPDAKLVAAGGTNDAVALARYLPTYCVVPKVIGRPLAAARSAIAAAHCTAGKVTRVASKAFRAGRVVRQTPRGGVQLAEDGRVALVLSRGRR